MVAGDVRDLAMERKITLRTIFKAVTAIAGVIVLGT
jgi:hypothetical protein